MARSREDIRAKMRWCLPEEFVDRYGESVVNKAIDYALLHSPDDDKKTRFRLKVPPGDVGDCLMEAALYWQAEINRVQGTNNPVRYEKFERRK